MSIQQFSTSLVDKITVISSLFKDKKEYKKMYWLKLKCKRPDFIHSSKIAETDNNDFGKYFQWHLIYISLSCPDTNTDLWVMKLFKTCPGRRLTELECMLHKMRNPSLNPQQLWKWPGVPAPRPVILELEGKEDRNWRITEAFWLQALLQVQEVMHCGNKMVRDW